MTIKQIIDEETGKLFQDSLCGHDKNIPGVAIINRKQRIEQSLITVAKAVVKEMTLEENNLSDFQKYLGEQVTPGIEQRIFGSDLEIAFSKRKANKILKQLDEV